MSKKDKQYNKFEYCMKYSSTCRNCPLNRRCNNEIERSEKYKRKREKKQLLYKLKHNNIV